MSDEPLRMFGACLDGNHSMCIGIEYDSPCSCSCHLVLNGDQKNLGERKSHNPDEAKGQKVTDELHS
jgi:hypothetical protein